MIRVTFIAVAVLALAVAASTVGAENTEPKTLVTRYVEALNANDADALSEIFAPDVVTEGEEVEGLGALKQRFVDQAEARNDLFREWRFEVRHLIAEGEAVALHAELVGTTHDGKPVAVPVMGFFEVRDGKIARLATITDVETFIEQTAGRVSSATS